MDHGLKYLRRRYNVLECALPRLTICLLEPIKANLPQVVKMLLFVWLKKRLVGMQGGACYSVYLGCCQQWSQVECSMWRERNLFLKTFTLTQNTAKSLEFQLKLVG